MWIKPKPAQPKSWKILEENAYFEMLGHPSSQASTSLFSDFVSTVKNLTSISDDSEPPHKVTFIYSFNKKIRLIPK